MSENIGNGLYSDAQVKLMLHYRTAAEFYLKSINQNPDETRHVPHPTIFGTQCQVKLWHSVVDDLVNFNMMLIALLRTQEDRLPPPSGVKILAELWPANQHPE